VRFVTEGELQLFAESVRGALEGFDAPLEPRLGSWWDERDDALGERLRAVGWESLWSDPGLLGAAVAGAVELGRSVAPLCLLDEATLGAPLGVGARARHAAGRSVLAIPAGGHGVTLHAVDVSSGTREPTLDGTGTVRDLALHGAQPAEDGPLRLRAWSAATLGYLAGLADAALEQAVTHVRDREQFGAPLGSLAAVQGRLANAAVRRDGLALVAWEAADRGGGLPDAALAWAGRACREVTAQALQVHGGIGFALEGGIHRHYRRAKSAQVWVDAVLGALDPADA
jgi:hypothetical protein